PARAAVRGSGAWFLVGAGGGGGADPPRGGWRREHWVRLDSAGRPVGAIKVEFQRPRMKRGGPPPPPARGAPPRPAGAMAA
ncbi:MAG: hypothetical protein ACK46X_18395, partial [Candidatus Sericytochromatia bacterium]